MASIVTNGRHICSVGGKPGITTERITITPSMAERILAGNTKNRAVIKFHLKHLEQILTRGEWLFNGEPIIVSHAGRVLDGQHRLMACVNAGVPIDTLLVRGVDESAFPTIDRGVPRTVGSVLSIDGVENFNLVAAALKLLYVFCRTGGQVYDGGSVASGFSATTAREILEKHQGIRDSVRNAMRCNHFHSKSLLAALHYIFSMSDRHVADDLVEVILSGAAEKDRPFNVLREHVIYARVNRITIGNRSLSAKTIRSFNAEVTGEWIKKVQWRPDGQFPRIVGLDYESLESML
jgi:hypothetical protein